MLKLPTDKRRFWVLCSIAALLILGSSIWKVPQRGIPPSITDEKVKAELLNANRDNFLKVIQTIGGLGFIVTAVLAWRNLQLIEAKNVTDRFSKAVEMLADDKLEVRLGGIYSLERIARDSKADHSVVMEVLIAFIKNRTASDSYGQPEKPTQDVQSALTVIGRRKVNFGNQEIDLSNIYLAGADLRNAHLEKADLFGTHLEEANLENAHLEGADLRNAHLEKAHLYYTHLEGAHMGRVHLEGANIREAHFERANLMMAYMEGACLWSIYLEGASLWEADLGGADLITEEQIMNALLCKTCLPKGINPELSNRDCEKILKEASKRIKPD